MGGDFSDEVIVWFGFVGNRWLRLPKPPMLNPYDFIGRNSTRPCLVSMPWHGPTGNLGRDGGAMPWHGTTAGVIPDR